MFENLLESWSILDPDECRKRFFDGYHNYMTGYYLQKTKGSNSYETHYWVNSGLEWNFAEQDRLQGYIQRCILGRKWHYEFYAASNIDGQNFVAKVTSGNMSFGEKGQEFWGDESKISCIALFCPYIKAIASQRTVAEGPWLHFTGGTCFVSAVARWSGQHIDPSSLAQKHKLDETPEINLQLTLRGQEYFYNSDKDYGDRVFYKDLRGLWAVEKTVFLALVSNDGDHEGKLRFRSP
jgi:hypothetical protein